MQLLDEEGNLFGVVNVVDALFVLVVVAIGVAGASFVAGGSSSQQNSEQVTGEACVHPSVVDAINETSAPGDDDLRDVSVENVEPVNQSRSCVTLSFGLEVDRRDGLLYARGERLFVGHNLTLDLNRTVVTVLVTDIERERASRQTQISSEVAR
jgi:hypothetical protein